MSDIVELYDAGGSRFFYCDTFGFKKIRFKPVKFSYMLLAYNESDLQTLGIFPSLEEAQRRMKNELLDQLHGSFEDYDEEGDYGLYPTHAWSNPGSDWDWRIIRLSANKTQNINATFLYGECANQYEVK